MRCARQPTSEVVVYTSVDDAFARPVIVPNCAVLIAGGPNSASGQRFIDYLLTPAVEQTLAECEAAQMPVRSGVPMPAHVVTLDQLQPMEIDYRLLGTRLEELTKGFLKTWVDANNR
jgi:iron(III) transport system substrate-binding protein